MAVRTQTSNSIPCGSHPDPLTDAKLAEYRKMIDGATGEVRDILEQLYACVMAWWELPESKRQATLWNYFDHATNKEVHLQETPLEAEHIAKLDAVTPWMREILSMRQVLDALPGMARREDGKLVVDDPAAYAFRNMAANLAWHATEITLDREPCTNDKFVPIA